MLETKKNIVYSKIGGGSLYASKKLTSSATQSASARNFFGNKMSISSVGPQIDLLSSTNTGDLTNSEYFRGKNRLLKQRVQELCDENNNLRKQNEELTRLNVEYSNKITVRINIS
jgi:hypothetical protein